MCGLTPKPDPQNPQPEPDPHRETIDAVDAVRKCISEQMGMLEKVNAAAIRVRSAAENRRAPNMDDVSIMTGYSTILVNDMMNTAHGCAQLSANVLRYVFG